MTSLSFKNIATVSLTPSSGYPGNGGGVKIYLLKVTMDRHHVKVLLCFKITCF